MAVLFRLCSDRQVPSNGSCSPTIAGKALMLAYMALEDMSRFKAFWCFFFFWNICFVGALFRLLVSWEINKTRLRFSPGEINTRTIVNGRTRP